MAATDSYSTAGGVNWGYLLTGPAVNAAAVTLSDSDDLTYVTRAIYVGTGGDLKVTMQGGGTVTFVGVPTGTMLSLRASRIWSTGTSASNVVAVW